MDLKRVDPDYKELPDALPGGSIEGNADGDVARPHRHEAGREGNEEG